MPVAIILLIAAALFPRAATADNNAYNIGELVPEILKVMTLNVGHARADGRSQLLQSDEQAVQHLWRIVDVMKREDPHVIAFQEIDRNSFWNGRFDHTEFLAENADYPHFFTGSHARGQMLDYGTALVAKSSLSEPLSVPFTRGFARPRKGFVLSAVDWPGREGLKVDVLSIHLDFLTPWKRRGEVRKLIDTMQDRDNPRILMGDLNTGYLDNERLIHRLEDTLDLYTWRPTDDAAVTFPKLKRRLDWVLVSPSLEIISHEVLPDQISDHRAVVAEIRYVGG